jgi:hypothetical protein
MRYAAEPRAAGAGSQFDDSFTPPRSGRIDDYVDPMGATITFDNHQLDLVEHMAGSGRSGLTTSATARVFFDHDRQAARR